MLSEIAASDAMQLFSFLDTVPSPGTVFVQMLVSCSVTWLQKHKILLHLNVNIKHDKLIYNNILINSSNRDINFTSYYNTDTLNIVNNLFIDDFNNFKYTRYDKLNDFKLNFMYLNNSYLKNKNTILFNKLIQLNLINPYKINNSNLLEFDTLKYKINIQDIQNPFVKVKTDIIYNKIQNMVLSNLSQINCDYCK